MVKKLKGEAPTLHEEIGSEERSSDETPAVDDVQPNDDDEGKDEGSSSQTLRNCGDTRDFNPPLNRLDISINDLEDLVNLMGEWTAQMGALDMRVAALEEDTDVNKMEALDMRVAALEKDADVNKIEELDMRLAALEAYVEKVGEDSREDVKREKNERKGIKRTVHTLDDNLSRTVTKFKKQK
ncbi:hypothetical protein Bca4012_020506 [Brassica carinata]